MSIDSFCSSAIALASIMIVSACGAGSSPAEPASATLDECCVQGHTSATIPSVTLRGLAGKETVVSITPYYNDRKAAVSFTYDDGIIDHYTLVAPHLEENGLRGTFWIMPARIPEDGDGFTWEKAREMYQKGHEISNHSWSHPRLTELSEQEIYDEIVGTDDAIERHLGHRPVTIAFPFNAYDSVVLAVAAQNRVGIRLHETGQGQGLYCGRGSRYATKEEMESWLQSMIDTGGWGITMTHGINQGWDPWEHPEVYWDFLRYAGSRSDEVWYGTFEQVSSYLTERACCSLKAVRHGRSVTVTPECNLDSRLYRQPLTIKVVSGSKVAVREFDPFGGPFEIEL